MQVAYGWTVTEQADPYVESMEEAIRIGTSVLQPGRWLVEAIPLRAYPVLDAVFLFSHPYQSVSSPLGFQVQNFNGLHTRFAKDWTRLIWRRTCGQSNKSYVWSAGSEEHTDLFWYNQSSGQHVESFTSQHLNPEDGHIVSREEEDIIKACSGSMYLGAADTVSVTVYRVASIREALIVFLRLCRRCAHSYST